MHQAAVLDGPALDALALQQDGLPPAEIDISWGQVVQALVVAPVVILFDKLGDLCPPAAPMGPNWRFE